MPFEKGDISEAAPLLFPDYPKPLPEILENSPNIRAQHLSTSH